jgi:uncharacterized membrane protein
MKMSASKLSIVILGLLLVVCCIGLLGPGPLVPGLGPLFDQFGILAIMAVFAIASVPWFVRRFRSAKPSDNGPSPTSVAADILRERYARGELNRAQFLSMLDDVKSEYPRNT